jgi:DNA-directed RNA polymerase subunit H (RpoH/RPB5)
MRERRGVESGDAIAASLTMDRDTYYRIERGAQVPSIASADVLGKWLGWTAGQVIDAARRPPDPVTGS